MLAAQPSVHHLTRASAVVLHYWVKDFFFYDFEELFIELRSDHGSHGVVEELLDILENITEYATALLTTIIVVYLVIDY